MFMAKKVLIVTNSEDLHADLVTSILISKGCPVFRINLDFFPRDYEICQLFLKGKWRSDVCHLPSGEQLEMAEVGAVWLRKPADYSFLSGDLTPQEHAFAKLETEHAVFGLLYALDCYWMSHPLSLRGAMWKGEQLQRATRMGFCIPNSIITNSPSQVKTFKGSINAGLIFKSMSTPSLAANEVDEEDRVSDGVGTTIITDELMDSLDSVSELPCHFQAYIAKQYELRVTIIGDQLFAAKINSQDDERTAIDSRDMSAEILYEAIELPLEITQRCIAFVKSYGLNFSALDIIVTPEGDYVFLENNPNGQFLYVQQLIPEFLMLEALAENLIKGMQCHSN
jgi:glutathione synthase/RimK-type ligase-like ATP-grasp enzyme